MTMNTAEMSDQMRSALQQSMFFQWFGGMMTPLEDRVEVDDPPLPVCYPLRLVFRGAPTLDLSEQAYVDGTVRFVERQIIDGDTSEYHNIVCRDCQEDDFPEQYTAFDGLRHYPLVERTDYATDFGGLPFDETVFERMTINPVGDPAWLISHRDAAHFGPLHSPQGQVVSYRGVPVFTHPYLDRVHWDGFQYRHKPNTHTYALLVHRAWWELLCVTRVRWSPKQQVDWPRRYETRKLKLWMTLRPTQEGAAKMVYHIGERNRSDVYAAGESARHEE